MTQLLETPVKVRRRVVAPWHGIAAIIGAAVVVLAAGIATMHNPVDDADVFWHLRTGEVILATGRLPQIDEWSAMAEGRLWVPHEWLGQVLYAMAYRLGDWTGVAVLRGLLVVLLVGSLAHLAVRRLSPGTALLATIAGALGTSAGWTERPQLLSFIFLVPAAIYVRRMVNEEVRGWWLVPFVWLWSMVHGLWFLPLLLLGVLGTVASLERRDVRLLVRLGTLGVASLAAALLLTPAGIDLIVATRDIGWAAQYIADWRPLRIASLPGVGLLLSLLLVLAAVARRKGGTPPTVVADIMLALALGFMWTRTAAVGTILLLTLLFVLDRQVEPRPVPTVVKTGVIAGLMAGLVGALVVLPTSSPEDAGYPAKAAAFVRGMPSPTVFNDYDIGAYLLFAAPDARPVIDQRTEIFSYEFVTGYMDALSLQGDWKGLIDSTNADVAIIDVNRPLAQGMRDILGWREVLVDGSYVVLLPPE